MIFWVRISNTMHHLVDLRCMFDYMEAKQGPKMTKGTRINMEHLTLCETALETSRIATQNDTIHYYDHSHMSIYIYIDLWYLNYGNLLCVWKKLLMTPSHLVEEPNPQDHDDGVHLHRDTKDHRFHPRRIWSSHDTRGRLELKKTRVKIWSCPIPMNKIDCWGRIQKITSFFFRGLNP